MPTNRTKRTRNRVKSTIDPAEIFFLEYGTSTGGPPHEHLKVKLFMRGQDGAKWKPVWEEVREDIMDAWIKKHPGTRCWAWWEIDAPRWERKFGAWFDGTKPEPRQRIGGTGTPDYEVLNYVPYFDKGIPESWVDKWSEDYYNGRSVDIHGKPIGTEYKEGDFEGVAIDENDPPVYESEAVYLERHGLLTASEKKWLAGHPEAMEPERVEFDGQEED
ncbi:MAG: hypothetical protein ISS63_02785 [Desulfobacteraceae bacterium]|nr:hypothetical protein [Desulfobacteraceae bacterium]